MVGPKEGASHRGSPPKYATDGQCLVIGAKAASSHISGIQVLDCQCWEMKFRVQYVSVCWKYT